MTDRQRVTRAWIMVLAHIAIGILFLILMGVGMKTGDQMAKVMSVLCVIWLVNPIGLIGPILCLENKPARLMSAFQHRGIGAALLASIVFWVIWLIIFLKIIGL